MTLGNRFSILAQAGREKLRQTARRMGRTKPGWFSRANIPERLLLAPQDLRTPDPTAARDIYSGRFFLAGKLVDCETANPFQKAGAPITWQQELHSFGWLRHLEADGSALTKNNAQALIGDWLKLNARPRNSVAWEPETAAKRLIYWLCHSVPVVETAHPRFYHAWMKSIGMHIGFLKYRTSLFPDGMPRLTARIALAYAANCIAGQTSVLAKARKLLDEELAMQILEDGGHISRNSAVIADILALLLPFWASAVIYYVSPSGNDTNNGTGTSTPCRCRVRAVLHRWSCTTPCFVRPCAVSPLRRKSSPAPARSPPTATWGQTVTRSLRPSDRSPQRRYLAPALSGPCSPLCTTSPNLSTRRAKV